jgi:hypothetical protein
MDAMNPRPKLVSFRVQAFQSESRAEGDGSPWKLQLHQEIQVGLAVPSTPGGLMQAVVNIVLNADAHSEDASGQTALFKGEYLAKFNYFPEVTEAEVADALNQEAYQYMLVAQAFPLAMTHFRRELQATGFDARHLPLGA